MNIWNCGAGDDRRRADSPGGGSLQGAVRRGAPRAALGAFAGGEERGGADRGHRPPAAQRLAAAREPDPRGPGRGPQGRDPGLLPHRRPDRAAELRRGLRQPARPLAGGAEAEDVPLTLSEALDRAEKANPELQAGAARVEAQLARTESVSRMRWPRLGLSMAWSRTDLPALVFANKLNAGEFAAADFDVASLNHPTALDHIGTNLSLEVPIDVFGKVGTLASAMAAHGAAASAGTRDATQEIRLRVVEAYRQAEMAGRAASVTERVVSVARAREAEIQARVETGGALQADLLRARARR